jgi:hypothetical protein
VSARAAQRRYSIKEAAALTGLPASTLRGEESIGAVAPISRGESSKQAVAAGDHAGAELLADEARVLAGELKHAKKI